MKMLRKRLLPLLLACALLTALLPLSAVSASAAENLRGLAFLTSNEIHWNGGNTGTTGTADWSGKQSSVPTGSRLAIAFDTTAMDWKTSGGDSNCWAFYMDMWSTVKNDWVNIPISNNGANCQTIFTDKDGNAKNTTLDFPNCPGWCYSFPAKASGWLIIDIAKEGYEIKDLTGVKFRPEGGSNLGSGAKGKTITIGGFGYVPALSSDSDIAAFEKALNMPGYCFTSKELSSMGEALVAMHKDNWDDVNLQKDIPDGARLVISYDATNVSTVSGKHVAFYLDGCNETGDHDKNFNGEQNPRVQIIENATQVTRLIKTGNTYQTVIGHEDGNDFCNNNAFNMRTGTSGYIIIDMPEGVELNDLAWFWFRNETGAVTDEQKAQTIGYQLGWVKGDVAIPDATVTAVQGLNVAKTTTAYKYTVTVAAGKEIKAGTLKVCDSNGKALGVPTRVGYKDLSKYSNTTQYTFTMGTNATGADALHQPMQNLVIKAEFVDTATATTPNFASIGVRANTSKTGVRFEYRFNLTRQEGNYYAKLNGQDKQVERYGVLMCTEKVYTALGGASGMTENSSNASLHNVDFSQKLNRVDACANYEDVCLAMINIPEKGKATNLYSRAYVVVNGQTYYSPIRYISYNNAVAGNSAATVA